MIYQMFCVYDSKARAFHPPFCAANADVARRLFSAAANDGETMLSKSPEDFVLFEVGAFDDSTGKLAALSPMDNLGLASTFKVIHHGQNAS